MKDTDRFIVVPLACGCIHRPYPHLNHLGPPATPAAARWKRMVDRTGGDDLGVEPPENTRMRTARAARAKQ